jgi:SSS family solute:Na+ symporter
MRPFDWVVLAASLIGIVAYGLWRGRGSDTVNKYLLAGKTMPWYAMALSIMATQASAITFISTSGQAYVDGMRFVQMYLGLPIAMILISMTAVPIFHRAGVYTAYEYLEQRFDAKTRALVSIVFLLSRGLASGVALYAPAVVLTVIFGWPDYYTTWIMGLLVLTYTVTGGIQAVTWTDFQQMLIMFVGLLVSGFMAIYLLPSSVSFGDALAIAGAAGRLNPIVTTFSWSDQYNIWSGVIGGMFLALAYFGTDQSQVQRYLTGKSIAQSRLSLLFNAVAKIPMQFLILFTGAMIFVFYTFEKPPLLFEHRQLSQIQPVQEYAPLAKRYDGAFEQRQSAAHQYLQMQDDARLDALKSAQKELDTTRKDAAALVRKTTGETRNDTNYIFLTFVTRYLPEGFVGLIMAAIFAAAMSTISAEVNSLATVSVIDVYRRHINQRGSDRHYLIASRLATSFWCTYAILTAQFGASLGSLVEAVNKLGSFFYPALLGVFVLAFYFPRVTSNGAFAGVVVCEIAILLLSQVANIAFLWYNVIGCLIVIGTGVVVSAFRPARADILE